MVDLTRIMAGIVSYGSYVPYRRLKRAAIAQVLGVAAGKRRTLGRQLRRGQRLDGGRGAARRAAGARRRPTSVRWSSPLPRRPTPRSSTPRLVGAAAHAPGRDSRRRIAPARFAPASPRCCRPPTPSRRRGGRPPSRLPTAASARPRARPSSPTATAPRPSSSAIDNVIAEIEASASLTREFLDTWRAPGERFAHSWEERFALTQAYGPLFKRVIHDVLEKAKLAPARSRQDRARRAQPARRSMNLCARSSSIPRQGRRFVRR